MSNEYFPEEIWLWIETITHVDNAELGLKHKENVVRWSKTPPPKGKPLRKYKLIETES